MAETDPVRNVRVQTQGKVTQIDFLEDDVIEAGPPSQSPASFTDNRASRLPRQQASPIGRSNDPIAVQLSRELLSLLKPDAVSVVPPPEYSGWPNMLAYGVFGGKAVYGLSSAFIENAAAKITPETMLYFAKTLSGDPASFRLGYLEGEMGAVMLGLKNLYNSICELAALPHRLSVELPAFAIHELLSLSQRTHVELRMSQALRALRIARNVHDLIADMSHHPENYIAPVKQVGGALGARSGEWLNEDVLRRPARELGHNFGTVVGRVEFEVASEIVFTIGTEGVGNVMRAATAGHFARGGGLIPALIGDLKPVVQNTAGLQRFARSVQGEAEFLRAVEAAFDESAEFEVGALRSIRVKDTAVKLSAEQLAQWRKLTAGNGLPGDFARLWNQCRNPLADRSLAEIRRLLSRGDAVSAAEARALAKSVYNNWRGRFMRKLRNPANSALREQIERVGFRLRGGPSTSPKLASGEVLTFDHMVRRMDDPLRCVDPANLQFALAYENTATLEDLRNFTSVGQF